MTSFWRHVLTLTSFSEKHFDVNVAGKSRTEHFNAANLDILALNQLNYSLFKVIWAF